MRSSFIPFYLSGFAVSSEAALRGGIQSIWFTFIRLVPVIFDVPQLLPARLGMIPPARTRSPLYRNVQYV